MHGWGDDLLLLLATTALLIPSALARVEHLRAPAFPKSLSVASSLILLATVRLYPLPDAP